jgi:hypothetical protein
MKFPHGWAIEEFLKTNLKNKRAYARKRGYLVNQTNKGEESVEENNSDINDISDAESSDQGGSGAGNNHSRDEAINSDDSEGGIGAIDNFEEDNNGVIDDFEEDNDGQREGSNNDEDDIY